MGVYVKGIKMPTRCHECHFNVAGWCYATDRIDNRTSFVTDYPIQPWCPLVLVPEHGDLIDRDALKRNWTPFGAAFGSITEMQYNINRAPIVIPADPPVMEYPQVPGITPTVIAEKGDDRTTSTPVWTNYDRLISKTPEELARYYAKRIVRCYGCEAMTENDCFECQLDWLKSSADKEN